MTSFKTQIEKECLYDDDINKSLLKSTVYISYIYPRTNAEVAKLIYDVKNTQSINLNSIITHRRELEKNGWLINITPQKNRNTVYKSNVTPMICYIRESLADEKDGSSIYISITDKHFSALEKILDSNWFRGFFSNDLLRPSSKNMKYPRVYFENGNILRVSEPFKLIGHVISILGIFACSNAILLKKYQWPPLITSSDIVNASSFDSLLSDFRFDDFYLSIIKKFYEEVRNWKTDYQPGKIKPVYSNNFLDQINITPAFIPSEISRIMVRSGRTQLTVWKSYIEPTIDKISEEFHC